MPLYDFAGHSPVVPPHAWVAPGATLVGDVVLAPGVSIWFGAVLRADNGPIRIGEGSNVQDLCVLHGRPGMAVTVGRNCSIGHRAVLHGCIIGDDSVIGMGAIVLDGAHVGRNCLIAAGAIVSAGKEIPDHSFAAGNPARIIRRFGEDNAERHRRQAMLYQEAWAQLAAGMGGEGRNGLASNGVQPSAAYA